MASWTPAGVVAAHLASVASAVDQRIADRTLERGKCWILPTVLPVVTENNISPEEFYYPSVFVWLPEELRPELRLQCPSCSNTADLEQVGWTSRRVIDIDASMFILAKELKCKPCAAANQDHINAGIFSTCDALVLQELPPDMQAAFPAIMAPGNEGGLSRRTVRFIQAGSRLNMNSDQIRNVLLDMHMSRYVERKAAFEAGAAQAIQSGTTSCDTSEPKFFSSFDDPSGYAGFIPPLSYLSPFLLSKDTMSATDALWTGTIVVTATEAMRPAQAILPQGLASVCGNPSCPGFVNCSRCQTIQVQMTSTVKATPAIKVPSDEIELAVADGNGNEPHPVSTEATPSSSPSTPDLKRKRRPRRCQNRMMINGQMVICGLMDCPGRGGQKFCKNFVGNVKQRHEASETSKLSTLVTLVRPVRESELVAMEALQNMI